MDIALTPDLQRFVDGQVSSGDYESPSEVIRDGLRLLQLHAKERATLVADWRAKVAVGIEQLDRGESIDAEDLFAELRERNAKAADAQ